MKVLFVHQNFPGQYKYLAPQLARDSANEVASLTKRRDVTYKNIKRTLYDVDLEPNPATHPYVERFEDAVRYGTAAGDAAIKLRDEGFRPDIICAHPGWGETLYLRDIFPEAKQLHFCEFYFHPFEGPSALNNGEVVRLSRMFASRFRNLPLLFGLETCDWGITPTEWQHSRFPEEYRPRISVIHDGIDTRVCVPKADATFDVSEALTLSRADEVVTYVARNLEPTRGFPTFMKAVERLSQRRPNCHILIAGGDDVSYGAKPSDGKTYRELALSEVEIDPNRVHFLGKVPYVKYLDILRISSAHVYLTTPFVLSWSMMEAMACGALLVASDTAPVLEVIEDGVNGLLTSFDDPEAITERVIEALDDQTRLAPLREKARETIQERYNITDCLRAQLDLVKAVASGQQPGLSAAAG